MVGLAPLIPKLDTRQLCVVNFTPNVRLTPRGKAAGTNWVGIWVGSRDCLDLSAGKKLPAAGKTRGIVRSLVHTSSSSGSIRSTSSSSNSISNVVAAGVMQLSGTAEM